MLLLLPSLDSLSSFGSVLFKVGGVTTLGAVGLGLLGAALTPVCPVIGPTMIAAAFGGGATGAAGGRGAGFRTRGASPGQAQGGSDCSHRARPESGRRIWC